VESLIVQSRSRGFEIRKKLHSYSGLLKTELPLAAGVCVIAGQVLALGRVPEIQKVVLGFLTGFLISGSEMVSNDYFDFEVDKINHPERPLPSGKALLREVAFLTILFSLGGLLCAGFLGSVSATLAILIWVVGILYNWKFKEAGLLGNIMVSFSVAMTFIFGGVSVGQAASGVVWTFGALAFLFDLSEEIAGGAMDLEGDRIRSVRSLALIKGRSFALRVSVILLACFVTLSFVPYLFGWVGKTYVVLLTVTDLAVSYLAYKLLTSKTTAEARPRIRQLYLTLILFVIVFIVLRVF